MNKQTLLKLLTVLLLIAGIAAMAWWRDALDVTAMRAALEDMGAWSGVLFMGIYALGTVLFLPGSVLTLLGGALFGPFWGTFYNLTGATIGAILAFLLSRYIAADWVRAKTGDKANRLITGVDEEGWRFVVFTRLVPLFPFNALNFALGLTRIPLWHYGLASWLAMLPGAFAYTWLGYAGAEALSGGESVVRNGLLALSLLALVAFIPRVIKRMRSAKGVTDET